MAPEDGATSIRWYRSFYFRIGFSFVVFVVGLLVAQSLIFNVILTRPPFRVRSPNNLVAVVSADVGAALTRDPALDLGAYLDRTYPRLQPIHVLMKSGATAANRKEPLSDDIRRSVEAVLAGRDLGREGIEPAFPTPFVMAPIQVGNELRGMVVLPLPLRRGRSRATLAGWCRCLAPGSSCWRRSSRPRSSSNRHVGA